MKIDFRTIRLNNYNNQSTQNHSDVRQNTTVANYDAYPLGYVPHQINFGCTRKDVISKLNKMYNLPCAHCGKTMIPAEVLAKLEVMIQNKKLTQFTTESIDYINLFKKSLTDINLEVFNKIKSFRSNHRDVTLYEAMKGLRPEAIKNLSQAQIRILDLIDEKANILPKDKSNEIKKITAQARITIKNDTEDAPFMRKPFNSQISSILADLEQSEEVKSMYKLLAQIPISTNNIDSFIVKYAKPLETETKNGNPISIQNAVIKRNLEIAQRLLKDSEMSDDHLIAKTKFSKEIQDPNYKTNENVPKNRINNLIMLCRPCNTLKTNDELSYVISKEQSKENGKDIIGNTKKQIEVIENSLVSRPDKDLQEYLTEIKPSIERESKGTIRFERKSDKTNAYA